MSTSRSEAAIAGHWFDAQTSRRVAATLTSAGTELTLEAAGLPPLTAAIDAVSVSDRIGNIPRRLRFPGGGVFETADNDAVDALFAHRARAAGLVHWLEARWPMALAALAGVIAAAALFLIFGLPALADRAARRVPDALAQRIGEQVMQVLDDRVLLESKLPAERQAEIQAWFAEMTTGLPGPPYWLELYDAPRLGANAMALPARIVVVTDQLVELAENDDELKAVVAHELGHLEGRHSLRLLMQSAGISALSVAVFGDVSSLYAVVSAAPALLVAKHSRDFEREADLHAREWLARANIDGRRFDAILCRLETSQGGADAAGVFTYLATHPGTGERADCSTTISEGGMSSDR